ncbi:MAG: hypothetical protein JST54_27995 [Deltaproteobacteria bacterium]|nr:hypothetical protein [Deltaproteobacteria bacterium]
MSIRATRVTRTCGVVGVITGAVLAGLMLFSAQLWMQGMVAVVAALVFVQNVAPRVAPVLDLGSGHALWLFPLLGVGALASASVGVAIANVPVALSGHGGDRYSYLVKPVLAGVLFGSPFALMVGFVLGIIAAVMLSAGARQVTMPR